MSSEVNMRPSGEEGFNIYDIDGFKVVLTPGQYEEFYVVNDLEGWARRASLFAFTFANTLLNEPTHPEWRAKKLRRLANEWLASELATSGSAQSLLPSLAQRQTLRLRGIDPDGEEGA